MFYQVTLLQVNLLIHFNFQIHILIKIYLCIVIYKTMIDYMVTDLYYQIFHQLDQKILTEALATLALSQKK